VDDIFSETPDERVQKALTAYKGALMQAPGWKLFVYPEGLASLDINVGGLTYYVTFPDSNRTVMVSDFNTETAGTPQESSYHLKATQRPSLVFDTYSYIHIASDPDETVSFSPAQQGGYGWGSDFDFSFTEAAPGDTLLLEGNFNGSDALLIPATQEEIQAAFGGQLQHIVDVTASFSEDNAFLFFNGSDNSKIGVAFNTFLYTMNFTYLSGEGLQTTTMPFSHTTYGVHFRFPVTVGGYTFQDLFWDDALDLYYINTDSGRVNITNSTTPLFPFSEVLGKYIVQITVPGEPLPGQSATFTSVHDEIKLNLKTSGFNLDLIALRFVFDDESKLMALLVDVEQEGIPYVAQYVYQYTELTSGNITNFTRVATNGNGAAVEAEMEPLLDYLDDDTFKLDYYTATTPVLGQFVSQQNADFFFTGNLE
jgi:hypothetical protein